MRADVDAATLRTLAKELYAHESGLGGWLARHRPAVCPFELLVPHVPPGATVLDIGCGGGLFLGLLAACGRLESGYGIDPSVSVIDRARRMAARFGTQLQFDSRAPGAELPPGAFTVVSMIDVAHHVAPAQLERLLGDALDRTAVGGRFVYKDMAARPVAHAIANRVHDAVLARQWIHYVPIARVRAIAERAGFRVIDRRDARRFVYAHELLVAERPA